MLFQQVSHCATQSQQLMHELDCAVGSHVLAAVAPKGKQQWCMLRRLHSWDMCVFMHSSPGLGQSGSHDIACSCTLVSLDGHAPVTALCTASRAHAERRERGESVFWEPAALMRSADQGLSCDRVVPSYHVPCSIVILNAVC